MLAILPVSIARTNKFYIYLQCTYIVYIFECYTASLGRETQRCCLILQSLYLLTISRCTYLNSCFIDKCCVLFRAKHNRQLSNDYHSGDTTYYIKPKCQQFWQHWTTCLPTAALQYKHNIRTLSTYINNLQVSYIFLWCLYVLPEKQI